MSREIAILHYNFDVSTSILDKVCNEKITIFSKAEVSKELKDKYSTYSSLITYVLYPESANNDAKRRNYINQYFKEKQFDGFLHVIQANTKIAKDPAEFFSQIENMMSKLDYSVWFNTVTDPFNYVYNKYVPRLKIKMDIPGSEKLGMGEQLNVTSHSNTQYVIYDFSKVSDDLLKFNEFFSIPMYYIIEFLARRRNTKTDKQLYYMNSYFSVESEKGMFKIVPKVKCNDEDPTKEIAEKENSYYMSLKVDNHPDNNIDQLLELLIEKVRNNI